MKYIQKILLSLILLCAYAPSLSAVKLHIPTYHGVTPLLFADSRNNSDIAKLPPTNETTALFKACCADNLDSVKRLLENGANANSANKHGETPIYWAFFHGNLDIVKLLLENGADATLKPNYSKVPPLHLLNIKQQKKLLMSLIPTNSTLSQNAKSFIEQVIEKLAKQMKKNPTSAPKVPQNDDLFKSDLIKNPEQEIARIEEIVKILFFEHRQTTYTWPDKTTRLNKFDMICPTNFNQSPAEFRLKINFGINYDQYLFLRMLQHIALKPIAQPKAIKCSSSSTPSTASRYSKLIDIMIKCYKPSQTKLNIKEDIKE